MITIKDLLNENNDKVIRDAKELSSGTIASLTGLRKYSELDKIQNDFVEWIKKSKKVFKHWQQAWDEWPGEND